MGETQSKVAASGRKYSAEELAVLGPRFKAAVEVIDRKYKRKTYIRVFIGSDAVGQVVDAGVCKNSPDAVALGQALLKAGLFHHVLDDHDFKAANLFYRFMEDEKPLRQVGEGFWNIRADFIVSPLGKLGPGVNIGTQMSLAKLNSGKFLVIGCVELTPSVKEGIDDLTDKGNLMEAVIASHSFHTGAFPAFYKAYPDVPYYGTPRHLRLLPEIPWVGALTFGDCEPCEKKEGEAKEGGEAEDTKNAGEATDQKDLTGPKERPCRALWEPEVEIQIPAGAEYENPKPESSNHFSGVFVFHKASKTVHIDDTIMYFGNLDPSFIARKIMKCEKEPGHLTLHSSVWSSGLKPDPGSVLQLQLWFENLVRQWKFENLCCAHKKVMIGNAGAEVRRMMERFKPEFAKLTQRKQTAGAPQAEENLYGSEDSSGLSCGCG